MYKRQRKDKVNYLETSDSTITEEEVTENKQQSVHSGDDSMEGLLDEFSPARQLRRGEIIDGKVMDKNAGGVLVDIGYKSEGFIPIREMRSLEQEHVDGLAPGDEVIAYVISLEGKDGTTILSIDRARGEQGWRVLEKCMDSNENVTGTIIGANRGGAVVEAEGVQGFVPLSQLIGPARELYVTGGEEPKERYIRAKVEFKIIEINRRRNRANFTERHAIKA